MKLHDLYAEPSCWVIPFKLLDERVPEQNISHKAMPTWPEHRDFVLSRPYPRWYFFDCEAGVPADSPIPTPMRASVITVTFCAMPQKHVIALQKAKATATMRAPDATRVTRRR